MQNAHGCQYAEASAIVQSELIERNRSCRCRRFTCICAEKGLDYVFCNLLIIRDLQKSKSRLGDNAAGDAIARIASRIGLHIVGLFVHNDCGASIGEDAIGSAGGHGEIVNLETCLAGVVFADGDVLRQIAIVVACGIHRAVFLVCRIEVAACSFEIWSVADRVLMDMNGVLAERQVFEIELDGELAIFELVEGRSAGVLSGAGFDGHDQFVFRFAVLGKRS